MDAESIFYIVVLVALGGWLWYKTKTYKDRYMSQEWLDNHRQLQGGYATLLPRSLAEDIFHQAGNKFQLAKPKAK